MLRNEHSQTVEQDLQQSNSRLREQMLTMEA